MQATGAIPVRSTGTSRAGGGGTRGSHPLKYLAGLALQGLISHYEHEKAKQAYYSKWIWGKVFTSARHIAHSGGPLELVKRLLNEANALQHAYHQIPAEVRSRWRASYDRYMAQQPKPLAKAPKSWWERYLQATGRSAIIQGQVAMAQADTLRNVSRKSADSLIQLAKGFYYAAEERNQKKFDSVGEFLDYVSLGIPKGMYLSYVERANKAFDSPNDTANWLTFGLHGTLREAMVPEDAWSPEHWSNIIGTVGFIEGTGSFFKPKPVLRNTVPKIKKAESSQALKPVKEVEGTGDGVRRSFRESTQSDRELVDSLRKKYTAGKKRNVAAVKGKIDGDEIDLESVSGEFTDNDYFNKGNFKPPQPEDYHYEGPISEFTSHTEQKIVEYLRLKYKDKADVKGKVEIISERPYCDNCIDLVDQFQKEFPNVEVVRVEVIPK